MVGLSTSCSRFPKKSQKVGSKVAKKNKKVLLLSSFICPSKANLSAKSCPEFSELVENYKLLRMHKVAQTKIVARNTRSERQKVAEQLAESPNRLTTNFFCTRIISIVIVPILN